MKISRRKFILCGILGLGVSSSNLRICYASDVDWKVTCRNWMALLLPSDEHGPGADTPIVWELLEQLMENNSKTKQWLIFGLDRLGKQGLPKNKKELLKMQKTGQPFSVIIRYLERLFVEYYYASPQGWKELGILSTPQPNGFTLKN